MFFDTIKLAEFWNIRYFITFRIKNRCLFEILAFFEIVAPFDNQFKWQIVDKKRGLPTMDSPYFFNWRQLAKFVTADFRVPVST